MGDPFINIKGLAAPARRALAHAGYVSLEQLADVRANDLQNLHGMGPKALKVLAEALKEEGLSFKAHLSRES